MAETQGKCFAAVLALALLIPATIPYMPELIEYETDPLVVGCMANTPIILNFCVMVWPYTNKPDNISSLECRLNGVTLDCFRTAVLFTGVPAGIHRLVIRARTSLEEASATYRLIVPVDSTSCTTHLINRGITVENHTAVAEFSGFGPYTGFLCKLDNPTLFPCESPLVMHNLTEGVHWLRVIPDGCKEKVRQRQTFFFNVTGLIY